MSHGCLFLVEAGIRVIHLIQDLFLDFRVVVNAERVSRSVRRSAALLGPVIFIAIVDSFLLDCSGRFGEDVGMRVHMSFLHWPDERSLHVWRHIHLFISDVPLNLLFPVF